MSDREKKNKHYDFNITNSCSAHDCTGLIPAKPETMEEFESYHDIVNFEPPMLYYEEETKKGNKI